MASPADKAPRASSSIDISDTESGPLLDEFPEKTDIQHHYRRQPTWRRISILKWPILISGYTIAILFLQRAFYFRLNPGIVAGRDVNGLVPECMFLPSLQPPN